MMLENAIPRSPAPPQTDPATHAECLEFVRSAIASNDQQTARDIAAVLKDCYQRGYIDRAALWADLSQTEQHQFKELLAPSPIAPLIEKIHAAKTWAEAESVWDGDLELKAQIKAALSREELVRIGKLYKQAHPPAPEPIALPAPETILAPAPEPETVIAPEDAEKMRDIALVWWPEQYPDQLQSLVTQMFGWGAPARRYSAVQIARWLQGEDDLVKYRIGELMAMGLADQYENDAEE